MEVEQHIKAKGAFRKAVSMVKTLLNLDGYAQFLKAIFMSGTTPWEIIWESLAPSAALENLGVLGDQRRAKLALRSKKGFDVSRSPLRVEDMGSGWVSYGRLWGVFGGEMLWVKGKSGVRIFGLDGVRRNLKRLPEASRKVGVCVPSAGCSGTSASSVAYFFGV